tara:strand:+ start:1109 stop:1309 length:201 start_codon:yes stop_codon:yes gene_type:complete
MLEIISLLTICLVVVLLCNCTFNLCSHFWDCNKKEKKREINNNIDIPIVVVNPDGNIYIGTILDDH